jgi:hypothetical protein
VEALSLLYRSSALRAVIVIGLLVLLAACVSLGVFSPLLEARAILADVKRLDRSSEPGSAFKAFRQKHRGHLVDEQCRDDSCESEFLVSNWFLSRLHLAPRTELRVWMMIDHQNADFFHLEYTSFISKQHSPVVHVQEDFCAGKTDISCDHFALNPHGRNVSPAWNGDVEFGQLATNEQKEAAWELNLNCLVAVHGCADIAVLLPTIWRTTGPKLVSSCFRSSADSLAEASQPLSEACGAK